MTASRKKRAAPRRTVARRVLLSYAIIMTAFASVDKPFLLGLPMPTGVVTDDLAMAVLLPPNSTLDGDESEPQWVASRGRYDCKPLQLQLHIGG